MSTGQVPLVVMGVSGAGKSTVASAIAEVVGVPYVDADDLHPPANLAKMASGSPLTDTDREPWLVAVADVLASGRTSGLVVACSALRRVYRDALRAGAGELFFACLDGDREVLEARLRARRDHFMPAALLDSQLATLERLEPDERGVRLSVARPLDDVVEAAVRAWHEAGR